MRRITSLIAGIALIPAALATANAQAGWPAFPEDYPQDIDYSPRFERGTHRGGAQANRLTIATTLASSTLTFALSRNRRNGATVSRKWGWTALGVGATSLASALASFRQPKAQHLLGIASMVTGGVSMMTGGRVLKGSWPTPERGPVAREERLSIAPITTPTAKAAGVSVTIRF